MDPTEITKKRIDPAVFNKKQTAAYLGMSEVMFLRADAVLVARGRLKPILFGKRVKYRKAAIDATLAECERRGEAFFDQSWL